MKIIGNVFKAIGFLVVAALILSVLAGRNDKNAPTSSNVKKEEPMNPCTEDIKKCKDNRDVLAHYKEIPAIKARCRSAVDKAARYGEPDWPWIYFDLYREDNNMVLYGVIELIENDVKIKNMYGTPEKSTVSCYYSLETQKITSLSVNDRNISTQ